MMWQCGPHHSQQHPCTTLSHWQKDPRGNTFLVEEYHMWFFRLMPPVEVFLSLMLNASPLLAETSRKGSMQRWRPLIPQIRLDNTPTDVGQGLTRRGSLRPTAPLTSNHHFNTLLVKSALHACMLSFTSYICLFSGLFSVISLQNLNIHNHIHPFYFFCYHFLAPLEAWEGRDP